MQLKEAINLKDLNKGSICLPDNNRIISDRHYGCYVSGWGRTSYNGKFPFQLQHAKVFTVPTQTCNLPTSYNQKVNGTQYICAGYIDGGVDACQGDSGGPLACRKDGW